MSECSASLPEGCNGSRDRTWVHSEGRGPGCLCALMLSSWMVGVCHRQCWRCLARRLEHSDSVPKGCDGGRPGWLSVLMLSGWVVGVCLQPVLEVPMCIHALSHRVIGDSFFKIYLCVKNYYFGVN